MGDDVMISVTFIGGHLENGGFLAMLEPYILLATKLFDLLISEIMKHKV